MQCFAGGGVLGSSAGFFCILALAFLPARISAAWLYDASSHTITDGNWVLSVEETGAGGLGVKGVESAVSGETLDLRPPVSCPDGVSRSVVSLAGFGERDDLRSVFLPESLVALRDKCFYRCHSLTNVAPFLGEAVAELGESAFSECTSLAGDLRIGNPSLTTIRRYAFYRTAIGSADLPHVVAIGQWGDSFGFSGCGRLADVNLPAAERLEGNAFADCPLLGRAGLPSVKWIGDRAFFRNYALTNVAPFFADTLGHIGEGAFQSCTNLAGRLAIANPSLTAIPGHVFSMTRIVSADLPGVETLGDGAFYGTRLESVDLPRAKSVGNQCFACCGDLGEALLPAIERLGDRAFFRDYALTNVAPFFADTLGQIGESAFQSCTNLAGRLAIANPSLTAIPGYVFWQTRIVSADLPRVETLGDTVFQSTRLESVALPRAKSIGNQCFRYCGALGEALLPAIERVGDFAFRDCVALTNVAPFFADTLEQIGLSAFESCRALEGPLQMNNPACTNFAERSFNGAGRIAEVRFPRSRVSLAGARTFYGMAAGTKYYFPGYAPEADLGERAVGNASGTRNVLYGSLRMDPAGWGAIASPLTAEDMAAADYPGKKTFGVLVEPGSGTRHWLVDWRSPFEPQGTSLLLR